MKASAALVKTSIVTFLLVTGLSACSSSPKQSFKPVQQEPVTIAESQAPVKKQSAIKLKESHPRKYTVKKGDTLWDISSLFLKDPWYWPEIWHKNQQVKNPHLIYPGDILTLIYVDGQPQILLGKPTHKLGTADGPLPVKKLGPSIRREGLEANIATIPGDAIRQFVTKPRVVTKKELDAAPYILASDDEHLILGEGHRVYIRGEIDKERVRYTVFRPGDKLINPENGELLGYEAIYAGEAHISEYGDTAIGTLTFTEREVLIGDRLLPQDKSKINNLYFPRVPDRDVKGQIISLFDALFGIAKYQIAVINRGNRDGIEVGHLLETRRKGATVNDTYAQRKAGKIELPEERSGLMMIFSTFDHVSYGLMLESTRVIHNHDIVVTPQ
jgi:LysM repeat protein